MFKLYELSEQFNRVNELLEESDDKEALKDTLEALDMAFDDKVESIVKLMRSKELEQAIIDNEAKRLIDRSNRLKKDSEWLKEYVFNEMRRTHKDNVPSKLFSIKLALKPPSVKVDEKILPKKFYRIIPASKAVDKTLLAERLKAGEVIKGAWLEQGKSLRIK